MKTDWQARPSGTGLGLGEPTPVGFLKAGFLALGGYLLNDPGVKSGSGGLTARRGPVALGHHCLDHLVAGHGFAGLGQDLSRGVQSAELWGLFLTLGLLGFLGLGLLGTIRCCHDTSPESWGF